ncbi:MAG TPA: type II secretion system minor pseudopilin GspI [Casimicrobiaceae bacterium]|nr:type II secretion system minor pseudopilin GspI [Casimicrobiaceae bacterium]
MEPRRADRPDSPLARDGFTLVEVLVALAIVAVALAAGFRSVAQSAESATALKSRTLALWVAQNRLAAAQLESPVPPSGERTGTETQAGAAFTWRESVSGTPNPAFRKIEIDVGDSARPDYTLARLVGYLGQAAQR